MACSITISLMAWGTPLPISRFGRATSSVECKPETLTVISAEFCSPLSSRSSSSCVTGADSYGRIVEDGTCSQLHDFHTAGRHGRGVAVAEQQPQPDPLGRGRLHGAAAAHGHLARWSFRHKPGRLSVLGTV